MKTLPIAVAALLLASPAAQAAQAQSPLGDKPIPRSVVQKDVTNQFAALDGNRDGFLTLTEWLSAEYNNEADVAKAVFAKIDADRDERVSKAELTAWQYALFDCIDADADGAIQPGEGADRAAKCLLDVGGFPRIPSPPKLETSQHR